MKSNELLARTVLFKQVKTLIEQSRRRVAVSVNAELTLLYWHVGKAISQDVLANKRAEYGRQVVSGLAADLTTAFGKGWGERHLRTCVQMTDTFPDVSIVHTLCAELSWSQQTADKPTP